MSGPARYRALAGFVAASPVFVAILVALTLSAFHHAAHHVIGPVPVRLLHQSPCPVLTIA